MKLYTEHVEEGYEPLWEALLKAFEQAQSGKGRARHVLRGEPFLRQPIMEITRRLGRGFVLGQAVKKIYESDGLPPDRAVAELLGSMVYVAAGVISYGEELEENAQ